MADWTWKDFALKIVNVLLYFLFLGSNVYTVEFPYIVGRKITYLTPDPWAYLIWSVIHLLLLGTIIYQFFPGGKAVVIDGISWRFPVLVLFNSVYVHLFATNHYILAFVMSLFVSSTVTHIYYVVKKFHAPQSWLDEVFVHLPFSLWHGWTTVLVLLSAFTAFGVDATKHAPGVWTKVFVFLALFFLEGTAATYSFSTPEGDLPASIAIAWSLWAIFAYQQDPFIHWSALAFSVLALIWVVKATVGLCRRGRIHLNDEETAPILGARS